MRPTGSGSVSAAALTAALFTLLVPGAAARTSTGSAIDNADHAAWSPDSRLIAFVYSRDHLSERRAEEIDTVDPATRRRRVVVAPFAPGTELYGLDWSAGGLLFSSCCPGDVWLSRLDGAPPRLLVAGARDATWSPDGGQLAFIADEQLQVMRPDGSSRRVLAPSRGHERITEGGRLSWSPDEGSIAYIDNADLFVYSFAEERSTRLTSTAGWENNPAWAPDGTLIAYANGSDLVVIRPDGSGRALLYDDPDDEGGADRPSWSPDSREIAFGRDGVWILDRNGRRRRAVTRGFVSDPNAYGVRWSPDGTRIAYAASRMCPGPIPYALAVANVSSRTARFLTANCVRRGTQSGDLLRGTGQNELLFGFRGDDVIRAAGGSDVVQGGRGDDRLDSGRGCVSLCSEVLRGGRGDDILVGHEAPSRLDGGLGRDRLVGGPGYDLVLGGRGIDHVSSGGGRDSIHVRDGFRDYVRCGRDADFVVADSLDVIARDCERVRR